MNNVRGVCFLLFAMIGGILKIFTVKELESRAEIFKEAGMIGPPFETVRDDENHLDAILRLIPEETGFSREFVLICDLLPENFELTPGISNVSFKYGYGILLGDPSQKVQPRDTDIEFADWRTLDEVLAGKPRVGTKEIFAHFKLGDHLKTVKRHLQEQTMR